MTALSLNTTDFRHAFEAEQDRVLRRRFINYCAVVIALIILLRLVATGSEWAMRAFTRMSTDTGPVNVLVVTYLTSLLRVGIFAWALVMALRRTLDRRIILRLAFWLVVASGTLLLLSNVFSLWMKTRNSGASAFALDQGEVFWLGATGAAAVFITHFFACLFLPWKPLECLRPVVPLLILNAVITLVFGYRSLSVSILTVLLLPAVVIPGLAVAGWRFSRFRERFVVEQLHGRYREMRRELIDARRLHEALFPAPIEHGPLRLGYVYEPMRQIGGDYLFARFEEGRQGPKAFHMLLVDVTGHGIAAALTVNRLYGEIERLFAENPDAGPGLVLAALNRYVHLTLARHSVYVTALCVRIDLERDVIEYASGGHPPAFLAAADGTIHQLDSTSFVLGACAAADFEPNVEVRHFAPGDTLVAYTDGAIEARNAQGRMLGITGLRTLLATAPRDATDDAGFGRLVLRAVDAHRSGPPEDDTLVVEVNRPARHPLTKATQVVTDHATRNEATPHAR